MERAEFGKKVRSHDWYYGYSDDYGVWSRGNAAHKRLAAARTNLDCPFTMGELRNWAHNMILEQFEEMEPGKWWRVPRKWSCIAPTKREDLMTQAQHDEITQWMALGATAEEIAKIA